MCEFPGILTRSVGAIGFEVLVELMGAPEYTQIGSDISDTLAYPNCPSLWLLQVSLAICQLPSSNFQ